MLQYRLSTMMIATLLVACLCCVMVVVPPLVNYIIMMCGLLLLMPAVLTGLLYGRDGVRAFAVGCAPPVSIAFYSLLTSQTFLLGQRRFGGLNVGNELEMKIYFAVYFIIVGLSGATGWLVYKWGVRQRNRPDAPKGPSSEIAGASAECPTCGQEIAELSNPRAGEQ